MWNDHTSPTFLVVIAASIVAHVAALAILPPADAAAPAARRAPSVVVFETVALPPPRPPSPPSPPAVAPAPEHATPAPDHVAARAPAPRAQRPVAHRARVAEPRVASAEPPAGPEAPVDFAGVTLSNEGASWSSPTGNGEPMTGPIARSGSPIGVVRREPSAAPGPRVVAVGDLSRPPRAPNLDAALAANYPAEARRAGTTGKALVRARIEPDGRVGAIRIVSESAPGFGTACKRTLTGSRWDAPLDARSERVATDVSYTCTFAVAR